MLELGNPPYQTTGDLRTHMALIDAVMAAIPCLTDWAKTTGHGETHQRDVDALRLCVMAIDVLREEYSRIIQPEQMPGDWPKETLKLIRPYQYQKTSRTSVRGCDCRLKGDPYKAPEQHSFGCPWRTTHPYAQR